MRMCISNLDREFSDVVARNANEMIDLCDTTRDDLILVHDVDLLLGIGPVHWNWFVEARLQVDNRVLVDVLEVQVVLEICSELVARHPCDDVVGHARIGDCDIGLLKYCVAANYAIGTNFP